MRNDYMFKAVFQQNTEALKALLASLLGRKVSEIKEVRLDEDDKSFYSEYTLTDRKTGEVYSEKLRVNVLSLKNIENAVKEQRESGLYDWAKFFAASTWEDLRMAAMESDVMQSAVVTMRNLTANDKVRLQCEARERYNLDLRTWQSALRREKAGRQAAGADKRKAEDALNVMYEFMRQNPALSATEILDKMKPE